MKSLALSKDDVVQEILDCISTPYGEPFCVYTLFGKAALHIHYVFRDKFAFIINCWERPIYAYSMWGLASLCL